MKMKYKRIFRTLLMAICATMAGAQFTSCSDSETESPDVNESTDVTEVTKEALSISASKQSSSGSEARKDGYDAEDFESGDEIGLYVLSADDLQSAYIDEETCYNVRATYDGSNWTMDNDIFLTNGEAYVIAYYPYDSSFGNTLSTSEDGTLLFDLTPSGSEQTDVLASEGVTVSSSSPQANLWLSHVLTRITLSIKVGEDTDEEDTTEEATEDTEVIGALTSASISADELYSDIGIYLDDGSFTTYTTTTADEGLTLSLSEDLSTGTDTTVDLDFLVPSESSTTLTVALVIDGTTYSFDIEEDAWTAGYQYIYNVTVTTEEESSGATYNGYEAVDLGVSVLWASMNVGATSEEEYGNYYAFGEIETKNDYSSSTNVTYKVEMEDFSGKAEYDAATANWGEPWRMPTSDQMQELVDKCTWTWGTMQDEDGNDVYGYYVTGNGNSIFLPAGGYCALESAKFYNVNEVGYYWSSTPLTDSSNNKAYYLYFYYDSSNSEDHYSVLTNHRFRGRTVRPVVSTTSSDSSEEE